LAKNCQPDFFQPKMQGTQEGTRNSWRKIKTLKKLWAKGAQSRKKKEGT